MLRLTKTSANSPYKIVQRHATTVAAKPPKAAKSSSSSKASTSKATSQVKDLKAAAEATIRRQPLFRHLDSTYENAVKIVNGETQQGANTLLHQLADHEIHRQFRAHLKHPTHTANKLDYKQKVFRHLKLAHFNKHYKPFLLKRAAHFKLFDEILPEMVEPTFSVEATFGDKERVVPGVRIPVMSTLSSPSVTIIAPESTPSSHYTIALLDMDRANTATNSYEEWCHWMVSNIHISSESQHIHIQPSSTPYIDPAFIFTPIPGGELTEQPVLNSGVSTIPGDTIFPYIPSHPPKAVPIHFHRYVIAVLRQSTQINREELLASFAREDMEPPKQGSGEEKMDVVRRSGVRLHHLITKHNMELVGWQFFINDWRLDTPQMFKALSIHQPVLGEIPKDLENFKYKVNQVQLKIKETGEDVLSKGIGMVGVVASVKTSERKPVPKI